MGNCLTEKSRLLGVLVEVVGFEAGEVVGFVAVVGEEIVGV